MFRVQLSGLIMMACVLMFSSGGSAQELPVKAELPPPESGTCETDEIVLLLDGEASSSDRERAQTLLSEANQASILGDEDRARSLLREAAELDPESSEVAYRLGRLLQAVGDEQPALLEFCRYLVLDPEGADVSEVEERIEALAGVDDDPIPGIARIAFERGVSSLSDERFEEAALHFSRALVELPNWPDAHYNRGLAYLGEERAGAGRADLERYLELDPGAPDADRIRDRLQQISPTGSTYNPRTALYAGIVFPGLGHFYSGRPATGMLFLTGAGASAAAALLHTETVVNCLAPPDENGECPPGQARDRVEERPLMVPGLAVAGAITLVGAIHAFVSTPRGQDRFASITSSNGGGLAIDVMSGTRWTSTFEVEPRGRWGADGVAGGLRIRF